MFSAMQMDAYRNDRPGIHIAYQIDGELLTKQRMHSNSRVSTATIHELLFADNCALNATTDGDIQRSMDLFTATCNNFGQRINTGRISVMHQPPRNTTFNAARINVNGAQLISLNTFTYLGSNLLRSTKIDVVGNRPSPTQNQTQSLQSCHIAYAFV
ncbi:unnamed protein product [Schistocephalus solidus]|uniref:Reverse transcriptase domain-containing protein n=1 Tax=Schistocephalus solidus TaxID=70667 RepID=A0A183TBD7_SCHSO|nr:unnamed protein product [Schistocephalus solidus]